MRRGSIVGILLLLPFLPSAVLADHMNGRFFGTGDWANYALQVVQSGLSVSGEVTECGQPVLHFTGQSDGGDNAYGHALDLASGVTGQFQLAWTPGGTQFAVAMADGSQYAGFFGHRQSANGCGEPPPPPRREQASPPPRQQESAPPARREAAPPPPRPRPPAQETPERGSGGSTQEAPARNDAPPAGGGPLPTF